eukprot:2533193-Alexandrium_andersonii.AAC.1
MLVRSVLMLSATAVFCCCESLVLWNSLQQEARNASMAARVSPTELLGPEARIEPGKSDC